MPTHVSSMEPPQPMILPKGLVVNTHTIYDEVAGYRTLPLDKVWKIWQVYTTTNKKLKDPTARRLENFWWHVLGSDRQHLSGRALARLFEDISVGPTFVPLKGPPNRWEGPDQPEVQQPPYEEQLGKEPGTQKRSASHEPPPPSPSLSSRAGGPGTRALSSSALKPPPSHPILKKERTPSSSGPRPTARFVSPNVSPHESEDDKGNDSRSSSSTAAAAVTPLTSTNPSLPEIRSSTSAQSAKKKPSKKFVASSTSKRRPLLPRRASSQSSTNSENGLASQSSGLGPATRNSGSVRAVSPIPERPSTSTTPQSHEDKLSTPPLPSGLSEKAAGKRPMAPISKSQTPSSQGTSQPNDSSKSDRLPNLPPKTANAKHTPTPSETISVEKDRTQGKRPPPLKRKTSSHYAEPPPPSPKAVISQVQSMVDLTSHRRRSQQPPTPPAYGESPYASSQPREVATPGSTMSRSQSHQGYGLPSQYPSSSSNSRRKPSNGGLFTKTTSSTTNIAALGTIIDQSGVGSLPSASALEGDSTHRRNQSHVLPSRLSSTSLLDSARMTPTQPSPSASVPLGRTMSQLTLLLEREKSRTGGAGGGRSRKG